MSSLIECRPPPSEMELLFDGPLSGMVIVLGVLGNVYCIQVIFSRFINANMLVSLTALAVWDIVLLSSALYHHSFWASLQYFQLNNGRWDQHMVAINGVLEGGHITATWLLIAVSAERCFAVTRPFHFMSSHRKHQRQHYSRLLGGMFRWPMLLTIAACVISIPCTFEYQLEQCVYNNSTYEQIQETDLMKNFYYKLFFRTIFLSVVKTFGPFVIITMLTISTVNGMRKGMENRATIFKEQGQNHLFKADQDKTRSLWMISIILLGKFLLLRCYPTAIAVLEVFFGNQKLNLLPIDISQFFLLLNSASNCSILVILKKAFETRRLKKIRMRQRALVAKHAEQVLSIGKALAGDKIFLLPTSDTSEQLENSYEMTPMVQKF
ncbi:unnamed protein product [Caenorhabditis auriculariae]|uniref:G-protein coupled receptors family 1 profile domain-containing protein n=1 Tax=Caenorhabditis auriculariae TaxID=2777116 RepID=A0A8S1GP52_9PELO|nr:unnamed protein product [Caenorhabditis auriculariae]